MFYYGACVPAQTFSVIIHNQMNAEIESIESLNKIRFRLLLFSVLSLYMEMMVIRYLGTEITIFSYFKNLSLMSAFLGLSLGFLFANSNRDYFKWSGIAFLFLNGIIATALMLHITFLSFTNPFEFMLFGVGGVKEHVPSLVASTGTLLIMLSLYSLSAFSFIGLGQRMGQLFSKLPALQAYSINIAGSLLGTAIFALLSLLETSPGIWMLIAGILFILVQRKPAHFAIIALAIVYMCWLSPWITRKFYGDNYVKTLWSPYYRIDLVQSREGLKPPLHWGWHLMVNYDAFQTLLDCSPKNLATLPQNAQKVMLQLYSTPYLLEKAVPKKVLILAPGNGSDVAGAIRSGVESIDAVDIDPVITRLGKTLHPEKPYLAPNVSLHVMDARTFLRTCTKKYDLIVFAYLDSHTAYSCFSSLRTDNYIFTKEAYAEANKLLNKNGKIYVSFICFKDYLWDRHCKELAAATGTKPLGYRTFNGNVNIGYLIAGPGTKGKSEADYNMPYPKFPVNLNSSVALAEDDWPFLFLPDRELSLTYMIPLFCVMMLSLLAVIRPIQSGLKSKLNWQMLMLGMGFMLLEVRAMADLSLLFGSTWFVNVFVISGILLVILLGNWLASRLSVSYIIPLIIGLCFCLLLSTFVRASDLTIYGESLGRALGIIFYIFPVTFAAAVFAIIFKQSKIASSALAFNLLGGLIGVSLEYTSMWLGVRALGWIAIAIYILLLATFMNKRPIPRLH